MDRRYYVAKIKRNDSVWILPKKLMEQFHLSDGTTAVLRCGSLKTKVWVYKTDADRETPTVGLSAKALKALCIPEDSSFLIKNEGNNYFRMGPVIGILTFSRNIPGRLGYYSLYAIRNRKSGLVYVFSGKDINKLKSTAHGYYYDCRQNIWKAGELPCPDVVINRLYPNPSRISLILEEKIGPNRIFNKNTLINKADFYTSLKGDKILQDFIPKTKLFTGNQDLKDFLHDYKEVFLKPVGGMKGMGIVKVKGDSTSKVLECEYLTKEKTLTKEICSINDISMVLLQAAGRQKQYVIQQGIPRIKYQGKPFSFRTWAMKNGKGMWVMPGMFAKGTFGNSFLTNFTAGAKLIPLSALFKDLHKKIPFTVEQVMKLLKNLTIKTAEVLDKEYGPLGELGLDIVFDITGKPWLIEANGNPGNIPVFMQTEYPEWRDLVFRYPMDYAVYLAGFSCPQ